MDSSSLHLPEGVIELILSNCPLKSVVRFKSVSKSWQSIISDRRFSRIHHIRRSKLPEFQNYFFVWGRKLNHHSYCLHLIRLQDGKFRVESSFVHPSGKLVYPLSYCDGLILLSSNDNKDCTLWNPLIGKHAVIPPESRCGGIHPRTHLYHDPITDDYKILFLYLYRKCYAIYSCNDGRWGEIRDVPRDLVSDRDRFPWAVFVDGCCYVRFDNGDQIIRCFDARDGMKLHKFRQPEGAERLVAGQLEAVSGRLCLHGWADDRENRLQLWVMEDKINGNKCWRKLISMETKEKGVSSPTPVCLNNEDGVVLRSYRTKDGPGKLLVYDSRGNRVFKQIGDTSEMDFHISFSYSENLYVPS